VGRRSTGGAGLGCEVGGDRDLGEASGLESIVTSVDDGFAQQGEAENKDHKGGDHDNGKIAGVVGEGDGAAIANDVAVTGNPDSGKHEHPRQRQRDEDLPTKIHELVVADARKRRSEPDEHEEEEQQLDEEQNQPDVPGVREVDEREVEDLRRAAEEQGDDDGAHGDRVHELGEEEQGESNRGVLGVEAADELLFGFDEVERRPVEFGSAGNDEDDERHEAGDDHIPAEDPVGLEANDAAGTEAAGHQDDGGERKPECCFVGDGLR